MNAAPKIDLALVHYPVLNKVGETISSAITNLDIHDIARAAKTFGVGNYHLVNPYKDQHNLVREITEHWQQGYGAAYNPCRKQALDLVSVVSSIEESIEKLTKLRHNRPVIIATSAAAEEKLIGYRKCRDLLRQGKPILLVFGTAHGLAPAVMNMADYCLPPISGVCGYNHLSVRSAVSIILDRLLGFRE